MRKRKKEKDERCEGKGRIERRGGNKHIRKERIKFNNIREREGERGERREGERRKWRK